MVLLQLNSRIDQAKVYAAGATITRVAQLTLVDGEIPHQVEIIDLPLALDDKTVKAKIEAKSESMAAIATDIRIGLAVPIPQEIQEPPLEQEIQQAIIQVQSLQDTLELINNEIQVLRFLDIPDRPIPQEGTAPPPSPIATRLALANFKDEQIRTRLSEKQKTKEELRQAENKLQKLQEKQRLASTVKEAKPHELRKKTIISLSYEGKKEDFIQQKIVLEYFIEGARWTPNYVCYLDSITNRAAIAIRALICQSSGEDWSNVTLELSTALPHSWCELPELPSIKIGRSQQTIAKTGWRLPPTETENLFKDFDQQKEAAMMVLPEKDIPQLQPPEVVSLPAIDFEGDDTSLDSEIVPEFLEDSENSQYPVEVAEQDYIAIDEISAIAEEFAENLAQKSAKKSRKARERGFFPNQKSTSIDKGNFSSIPAPSPQSFPRVDSSRNKLTQGNMMGARMIASPTAASMSIPYASFEKPISLSQDLLTYNLMRISPAESKEKRGKIYLQQPEERYVELLEDQSVIIKFNPMVIVRRAMERAKSCLSLELPPGGINVRECAGSFDYVYNSDARVDVPSDGQFHSIPLTTKDTEVDLRYVVVPREDTNVFRIAQLVNPINAPLLAGPVDIYVDSEYILSSQIATTPPQAQMELGLGVEQAIKVARNTEYKEIRSNDSLVAFNEFHHQVKIEIANRLTRDISIEVRERIPIPAPDAKVDVEINSVFPLWQKYHQQERKEAIVGGYHWLLDVQAGRETVLSLDYTIKTFVDKELVGGNRREGVSI